MRRPRVFSIMIRRRGTLQLADVKTVYQHICKRVQEQICSLKLSSAFIALPSEILKAENRGRNRYHLPPLEVSSIDRGGDWKYLLTKKQQSYLAKYNCLWLKEMGSAPDLDPDCLFDLSQDPDHRKVWSGRKKQIPTLRHAGNILWSPSHRRWMLPIELAVSMGFPVTVETARACHVEQDVTWHIILFKGSQSLSLLVVLWEGDSVMEWSLRKPIELLFQISWTQTLENPILGSLCLNGMWCRLGECHPCCTRQLADDGYLELCGRHSPCRPAMSERGWPGTDQPGRPGVVLNTRYMSTSIGPPRWADQADLPILPVAKVETVVFSSNDSNWKPYFQSIKVDKEIFFSPTPKISWSARSTHLLSCPHKHGELNFKTTPSQWLWSWVNQVDELI